MPCPVILDDVIAAIATAPGEAGLAVVRVSGCQAMAVADRVFRGAMTLASAPSHTLHHGWAVRGQRRVDEVVAAVFRAPRSYTREDVVELSCHGGALPSRRVLDAVLASGARLARPGEFTWRAFWNGRLDLAQAEAVADLIHADTEAANDLALSHLAGSLSRRLGTLADTLADQVAEVEARVDFAEDVGGIEVPAHVVQAIAVVDAELAALLGGAAYARALREGVRVPIVGRPNVGKSSLFNALIGDDRAIVTEVAGTTRDRVSEAIEIAGIRVTLSDTAGLRESVEPIERLGIARTRQALDESPLALWVVDASSPLSGEDHAVAGALGGKPVLVALNKSDQPSRVAAREVAASLGRSTRHVVPVSAVRGDGIDTLRAALAGMLGAGGPGVLHDVGAGGGEVRGEGGGAGGEGGGVRGDGGGLAMAVANPRHVAALAGARAALGRAREVADEGQPGEIVALELRDALGAIGEVLGRNVGDDLLERIFSRFCIGK